jgi:hypothetical protein
MTKREEDYEELGDEDLANLLDESDGAASYQKSKYAFETDYAGVLIGYDDDEEEDA